MPSINENFLKLEKNYLFINIAKKVKAFTKAHPEADLSEWVLATLLSLSQSALLRQ